MQDVKLRDEMRKFQSPVKGEEIMKTFKLKPGRQVGKIKEAIEEAIAMDKEEQLLRMESMTKAVEGYTVKNWAEDQMKGLENENNDA